MQEPVRTLTTTESQINARISPQILSSPAIANCVNAPLAIKPPFVCVNLAEHFRLPKSLC
jgi:hypothetical protein